MAKIEHFTLPTPDELQIFCQNNAHPYIVPYIDKLLEKYALLYQKEQQQLIKHNIDKISFDLQQFKTAEQIYLDYHQQEIFIEYIIALLKAEQTSAFEILTLLVNPRISYVTTGFLHETINKTYRPTIIIIYVPPHQIYRYQWITQLNKASCLINIAIYVASGGQCISQFCVTGDEYSSYILNQRVLITDNAEVTQKHYCCFSGMLLMNNYGTFMGSSAHWSAEVLVLLGHSARALLTGYQLHQQKETDSSYKVKVVAGDASTIFTQGKIAIGLQGEKSVADQQHEALLVSEAAQVTAQPMLEVETNQVQCKHGSALAPIANEHLWYLCTRGLSKTQAEELLCISFLRITNDLFVEQQDIWLTFLSNILMRRYRQIGSL